MRTTRLLLTLLVAVLAGVLGAAAPANAAESTVVSPGAAASSEPAAKKCHGDLVERCAYFRYDDVRDRVRPIATISSAPSAGYDVAVNRVRVQVKFFGNWVDADPILNINTYRADTDGWFNDSDRAEGGLLECTSGEFRAAAHYEWRRAGTNTVITEEWYSGSVDFRFC